MLLPPSCVCVSGEEYAAWQTWSERLTQGPGWRCAALRRGLAQGHALKDNMALEIGWPSLGRRTIGPGQAQARTSVLSTSRQPGARCLLGVARGVGQGVARGVAQGVARGRGAYDQEGGLCGDRAAGRGAARRGGGRRASIDCAVGERRDGGWRRPGEGAGGGGAGGSLIGHQFDPAPVAPSRCPPDPHSV